MALLLVSGWVLWIQFGKDLTFPRNFSAVESGLVYRSGRLSVTTAESALRDNNIGAVVSLISDNDKPEDALPMKQAVELLGIQRVVFPMNGNGIATPERYALAVEAMVEATKQGRPVLVHCNAGAQRTGGVVATYQMLVRQVDPRLAMREMVLRGHDRERNPRLVPWLNENMGTIATILARQGVIDRVPSPLPQLPMD